MAWAVHQEWGKAVNKVKRELSKVAQTIARYEPVRVIAPRGHVLREARREFSASSNIVVIEAPVDDIWMRDIAPTFAWRANGRARELVAIDWNFNGWGGTVDRPSRAGDRLAKTAVSTFGVPRVSVGFVAEGGALVTNGLGTMIVTRSCLLNPNRNPQRGVKDPRRKIEFELNNLGVEKVIWLEGDPDEPITSGHPDGYMLFAPSNVLLVECCDDKAAEPPVWRERDISLIMKARIAKGRRLKVKRVLAPRRRYWKGHGNEFAPCYLNAYVANGAVVGAVFGDVDRDEAARNALGDAFPGRDVVMLRIDNILSGGGGIHCLT
jgi:agmatine deiminase